MSPAFTCVPNHKAYHRESYVWSYFQMKYTLSPHAFVFAAILCKQTFDMCCSVFFFWNKQFDFISSQPCNFRFSNHIYSGQENLRCLCLTRWLANQGWLHWGLGHPKSATNIIEPWSNLVCYLPERRQVTQHAHALSLSALRGRLAPIWHGWGKITSCEVKKYKFKMNIWQFRLNGGKKAMRQIFK